MPLQVEARDLIFSISRNTTKCIRITSCPNLQIFILWFSRAGEIYFCERAVSGKITPYRKIKQSQELSRIYSMSNGI